MQAINLRLPTQKAAQELKTFLEEHSEYGQFLVNMQDANLRIQYSNLQTLELALDQYYSPRGVNWRAYRM